MVIMESTQAFSNGNNPFLLPAVLEHLFNLCKLEDLPRFRLVCKKWHSLSLTRCRDEMTVNVHAPPKTENPVVEALSKEESSSSENKLEWTMAEKELPLEDKPFKSLRLHDSNFLSLSNDPSHSNLDQLWSRIGPWIRKLELRSTNIYCTEAFKKIIFEYTPNLEELGLTGVCEEIGVQFEEVDDGQGAELESKLVNIQPKLTSLWVKNCDHFPITWRLLFAHFPNIQKLEINDRGTFDLVSSLTNTLEQRMEKASLGDKLADIRLKLEIANPASVNAITRLLRVPHVKLTGFHLDLEEFLDDEDDGTILPSVINGHAQSLRELSVCGWNNPSNFPFGTTMFPAMSEFLVGGNICRNLHFLENFPNLRKLHLKACGRSLFEGTDLKRVSSLRLDHLQELLFTSYTLAIPEEVMEVLGKVMPNVNRLTTTLNKDSVRVVCKNWRNMKELRVRSMANVDGTNAIDDESITGVIPNSDERVPCVKDLKYLQYFLLTATGNISEMSVWNGFLEMSHLHTVVLGLSKETSDAAIEALRKHVSNAKVTR